MPRVLPGVEISITDRSQVSLQAANFVNYGVVGVFEKGPNSPALISSQTLFQTYFGTYSNATDKMAWMTIYNILGGNAAAVYVGNVYNTSSAKYGAIGVKNSSLSSKVSAPVLNPFATGTSSNTSFDFTPAISGETHASVTNTFTLVYTPVLAASLTFTGTGITAHDDGLGNIKDGTNTTVGAINYYTGVVTLSPSISVETITAAYTYNTEYLFAMFAYSPKTWSSRFGIAVDSITKGTLAQIQMVTGGSGFTSAPTVNIYGGGGSGVTGLTSTILNGSVTGVSFTSGGTGFTSTPVVNFSGGGIGSGFVSGTATVVSGAITAIAIGTAGTYGLTSTYPLQIVGDGVGAVATATTDGSGHVTTITITNGGAGYTSANVTAYVDVGGTTATAIVGGVNAPTTNFQITEVYLNDDGTYTSGNTSGVTITDSNSQIVGVLKQYIVSRNPMGVDDTGASNYIEDVVTAKSSTFTAINNTDYDWWIVPDNATTVTGTMNGGANGTTPSTTEYTNTIALYASPSNEYNVFVGAGKTDPLILQAINNLVSTSGKERFAFLDTIASSSSSTIVTWATSTIGISTSKQIALYTPNAYTSFNGRKTYTPASSLVAVNYAKSVSNGKKYLPPAGIDRGSVDVLQLENYYSDADILNLHGAQLNVIKQIPGYGSVIFSDFTFQSKLTATSYINSVLTLNDMLEFFRNNIITANYKVINDVTYLEVYTLIDGYLKTLALKEGTIESTYSIKIDNSADAKDAREIRVSIVFVFQGLVQKIVLNLTYTTNALYTKIA